MRKGLIWCFIFTEARSLRFFQNERLLYRCLIIKDFLYIILDNKILYLCTMNFNAKTPLFVFKIAKYKPSFKYTSRFTLLDRTEYFISDTT